MASILDQIEAERERRGLEAPAAPSDGGILAQIEAERDRRADEGFQFTDLTLSNLASQVYEGLTGKSGKNVVSDTLGGGVREVMTGANRDLANSLAAGPDLIDRVIRMVDDQVGGGGKSAEIWQEPSRVQPLVQKAFADLGFTDPNIGNTFLANVGERISQGMQQLIPLMASAPAMAAIKGPGMLRETARTIGGALMSQPGLGVASEVGAAVGGEVGERLGGSSGEVAGAITGGGLVPALGRIGSGVARGIGRLGRGLIEEFTPPGRLAQTEALDPVRKPSADPAALPTAIAERVANETRRIENEMLDLVNKIPQRGTTAEANVAARNALTKAVQRWNDRSSALWSKVPNVEIDPQPIRARALQLRNNLRERFGFPDGEVPEGQQGPSAEPTDLYNVLLHMESPTGTVPRERLQDFVGIARRMAAEEQARGPAANQALIRNINELRTVVQDGIDAAMPNTDAVREARAFTTRLHDLLDNGPLSAATRRSRGGRFTQPPETFITGAGAGQSGTGLTRRVGGLEDLQSVARLDAAPTPELEAEAERAVMNLFRETAAEGGIDPGEIAKRASKFLAKNAGQAPIRPLTRVYNMFQNVRAGLDAALTLQRELQQGVLARIARNHPTPEGGQAIGRDILNSPNRVVEARTVFDGLRVTPEEIRRAAAEAGQTVPSAERAAQDAAAATSDMQDNFRASVIDELFRKGGTDADALSAQWKDPRNQELFKYLLKPDQFKRLDRIVDAATRLQAGDKKFLARNVSIILPIASRVAGAQIGRSASRMLGGSTIQTPGIFARVGSKIAENALQGAPPWALARMAVLNPEFERLMYKRLPLNLREARSLAHYYARALGSLQASGTLLQEGLND